MTRKRDRSLVSRLAAKIRAGIASASMPSLAPVASVWDLPVAGRMWRADARWVRQ